MPRVAHQQALTTCDCSLCASQYAQGLDELAFSRSACAAAQQGHVQQLQAMLEKHPEQINQDGTGGL
jgi:hypothetical protein